MSFWNSAASDDDFRNDFAGDDRAEDLDAGDDFGSVLEKLIAKYGDPEQQALEASAALQAKRQIFAANQILQNLNIGIPNGAVRLVVNGMRPDMEAEFGMKPGSHLLMQVDFPVTEEEYEQIRDGLDANPEFAARLQSFAFEETDEEKMDVAHAQLGYAWIKRGQVLVSGFIRYEPNPEKMRNAFYDALGKRIEEVIRRGTA